MVKAQGLKKVHINYCCPGGYNNIGHIISDHISIDLYASARACASCYAQDNCAILIVYHVTENIGSPGRVTGCERHTSEALDYSSRVKRFYIDMPDRLLKEILFFHFIL